MPTSPPAQRPDAGERPDAEQAPPAFDVLVLGAGSGGYACALRAAELGLRVALVERDLVGGTCLHRGCIPTKALLHVAETADAVRLAADLGISATLDEIRMPAALAFAARTVHRLHKGLSQLIASRGITVVSGTGRLTAPDMVSVDGPDAGTYQARQVVLATGSAPRTLPGVTVDGVRILTSDEALRLEHVPETAIVLGGGAVGVEFASLWRSLGAQVTVLEALDRLLPAEDEASSAALQRTWRRRGITVHAGVRVAAVEPMPPAGSSGSGGAGVTVRLEQGDSLTADVVLVAVGRAPVTDGLGLDEVGVARDRGFVRVDERLASSVPGVWAVGDVVAGPALAHRGFAHGISVAERIAAELVAGPPPTPVQPDRLVPRITYSDPEVASVGITEATARAEHGTDHITSFTYQLAANGRSLILGTPGQVKVVRRVDGPVVGIHVVGRRAGELMGEAQLIVGWEGYPDDVVPYLHAHPTQGEAIGEALLALAGKPLHVHG